MTALTSTKGAMIDLEIVALLSDTVGADSAIRRAAAKMIEIGYADCTKALRSLVDHPEPYESLKRATKILI